MLCTGGLPPKPVTCFIICTLQRFVKPDQMIYFLFFSECGTGRLPAVAGAAAFDVHMLRHALVVAVIDAFHRLTVDADNPARMRQGITEGIPSLSLLCKALTAGAVTVTGMPAAYHDVSLAAQTILIIGTIFHNTF